MIVKFKKLVAEAKLPVYATTGSAGADVCSAEDVVLKPMERKAVSTGLAIELPEGYEAQVRPRSGLAIKHGISLLNTPGTIDSDYRGELKVLMVNFGSEDFEIHQGDRIAQIVLSPVIQAEFELVQCLTDTERGQGGFGSTGVRQVVKEVKE